MTARPDARQARRDVRDALRALCDAVETLALHTVHMTGSSAAEFALQAVRDAREAVKRDEASPEEGR